MTPLILRGIDAYLSPAEVARFQSTFLQRTLSHIYHSCKDENYFDWDDTRLKSSVIAALFIPILNYASNFPADTKLATYTVDIGSHFVETLLHDLEQKYGNDRHTILKQVLLYLTEQYLYFSDIALPISKNPGEI